jgi:repressor LexA
MSKKEPAPSARVAIGKKVRELREQRGWSRGEFAVRLNPSDPPGVSTVRDWERGANAIKPDIMVKIAQLFEVPVSYFYGEWASERREGMIPILGSVRCGEPMFADENILGYIYPPEGVRADFALLVEGDSMVPLYYPETLIYVRQQPVIESGEIAVVRVGKDEATVKRVRYSNGSVLLIPLNSAKYETIECRPEELSIIGKVVYPKAQ